MRKEFLYYVAVPYTEEVVNLATFLSIKLSNVELDDEFSDKLGLFIYKSFLTLEAINDKTVWVLNTEDAIQVLALYAARDFNSVCEYLNNIPNKPFTVCIDTYYLTYMI